MFNFLMDIGNYDQRKVGRDDYPWGFVSTARVSDGRKPYETAVKHSAYGDGNMVIVECYDSKEDAAVGHSRWVAAMTAETPPETLTDCVNAEVAQLLDAMSGDGGEDKGASIAMGPLPYSEHQQSGAIYIASLGLALTFITWIESTHALWRGCVAGAIAIGILLTIGWLAERAGMAQ